MAEQDRAVTNRVMSPKQRKAFFARMKGQSDGPVGLGKYLQKYVKPNTKVRTQATQG
jgi:hypothetical protein